MKKQFHVLVGEDNPDDAHLLLRACQQEGVIDPPIIVQDGVEVMEYLQGYGQYADRAAFPKANVLLLDLKMPRKDGYQVLQWIQLHPEFQIIPTIVMSSSPLARDVKLAYCLGANGYLVKPTTYAELRSRMRHLFAFWSDCITPADVEEESLPDCQRLITDRQLS